MSDKVKIDILILSLVFQSIFIGMFVVSKIGIEVPVLRQLISFFCLIIIPGLLLFQIFNISDEINGENLLYIVGLSLFFIMFIGAIINAILPIFGITQPISSVYIFSIYNISIFLMIILVGYINRRRLFITIEPLGIYSVVLIIPFLSIFGAYFINFCNNNILSLFTILTISLLVLLSDRIPEKLYPLLVFVIALSLLYHYTLATSYLYGSDIHLEYYDANLVLRNSVWKPPTPPNDSNAMLSIVILAPIFSILCNMNLTLVFKILYPFLYSLVPVCLYYVFKNQTNEKVAFYSCLLFVFLRIFFQEMTQLARQQIAEIFLSLLLLIISSRHKSSKSMMLFVIFAFSLVVSHYGVSYVFLIFLPAIYAFSLKLREDKSSNLITAKFVILFTTFIVCWYLYITSGYVLDTAIRLGENILVSTCKMFKPVRNSALYWATVTIPISYRIERILDFIVVFSITIGFFVTLVCRLKPNLKSFLLDPTVNNYIDKFTGEFLSISLAFFIGYLVDMFTPEFTSNTSMGFTRFYHLSLMTLAPFCVIGFFIVFGWISKLKFVFMLDTKRIFKIVAIFFVLFLMFNYDFVAEVAKDYSSDISISKPRILCNSNNTLSRLSMFQIYVSGPDISSAEWIFNHRYLPSIVLCDHYAKYTVLTSYGMLRNSAYIFTSNPDAKYNIRNLRIKSHCYIYLRWINYRLGLIPMGGRSWWRTSRMANFLAGINKIYSNFESVVYYKN